MADNPKQPAWLYGLSDRVPEQTSPRRRILDDAQEVTSHGRNLAYGNPSVNFQRIAALWNVYLDQRAQGRNAPIEPYETAVMVALLKIARIMHDPSTRDNFVDLAGYAATAWEAYVEAVESHGGLPHD